LKSATIIALAMMSAPAGTASSGLICTTRQAGMVIEYIRPGLDRHEVEVYLASHGLAYSYGSTAKLSDPRPSEMAKLKELSGVIVVSVPLASTSEWVTSSESISIDFDHHEKVLNVDCRVIHKGP